MTEYNVSVGKELLPGLLSGQDSNIVALAS